MKNFLGMAIFLASISTQAATVKVTSFGYVRSTHNLLNPLAELCGEVEVASATGPTFLNILVDPGSRRPASYNTFADKDGKFCIALVTYRGQVDITIVGENESKKASIK